MHFVRVNRGADIPVRGPSGDCGADVRVTLSPVSSRLRRMRFPGLDQTFIRDTFPLPDSYRDNSADLLPDWLVVDIYRMNGNAKNRPAAACLRQCRIPTE